MRDLHEVISFRTPESLIGAIIFDAIEFSPEASIKKVNELEAIIKLKNTKENLNLIESLKYNFELMPFHYSTNQNSSKKTKKSKFIELHIHTTQQYFYKFNYHLTSEYNEFDEILQNQSGKLNKLIKKNIDNFLVEINFLTEYNPDPYFTDMEREWDIEYNKVVLALPLFEDEERFILFSKYVYRKIASMSISRQSAKSIWKNKSLWLEKFQPSQ